MSGAWRQEQHPEVIREFFKLLAVCHTVIPEGPAEPSVIVYQVNGMIGHL